jgi:hypothetical protein
MAFAKKSVSKEDVKASASNYINASGIYDVEILAAFVNTSKAGSSVVDFFLEYEGQQQVMYGNMRVTNTPDAQGETVENKIGMKLFNHLLVVADLEEVSDPVEGELPIGKAGIDKTVAILEDITDIQIQMRIQIEYSKYLGNISEKRIIREFYRSGDNATASEIVNDAKHGEGFEKDQKYVDNITYKDDLTPDDIARWVAGGRQDGDAAKGGAAKSATKAPSFGGNSKRFAKK